MLCTAGSSRMMRGLTGRLILSARSSQASAMARRRSLSTASLVRRASSSEDAANFYSGPPYSLRVSSEPASKDLLAVKCPFSPIVPARQPAGAAQPGLRRFRRRNVTKAGESAAYAAAAGQNPFIVRCLCPMRRTVLPITWRPPRYALELHPSGSDAADKTEAKTDAMS